MSSSEPASSQSESQQSQESVLVASSTQESDASQNASESPRTNNKSNKATSNNMSNDGESEDASEDVDDMWTLSLVVVDDEDNKFVVSGVPENGPLPHLIKKRDAKKPNKDKAAITNAQTNGNNGEKDKDKCAQQQSREETRRELYRLRKQLDGGQLIGETVGWWFSLLDGERDGDSDNYVPTAPLEVQGRRRLKGGRFPTEGLLSCTLSFGEGEEDDSDDDDDDDDDSDGWGVPSNKQVVYSLKEGSFNAEGMSFADADTHSAGSQQSAKNNVAKKGSTYHVDANRYGSDTDHLVMRFEQGKLMAIRLFVPLVHLPADWKTESNAEERAQQVRENYAKKRKQYSGNRHVKFADKDLVSVRIFDAESPPTEKLRDESGLERQETDEEREKRLREARKREQSGEAKRKVASEDTEYVPRGATKQQPGDALPTGTWTRRLRTRHDPETQFSLWGFSTESDNKKEPDDVIENHKPKPKPKPKPKQKSKAKAKEKKEKEKEKENYEDEDENEDDDDEKSEEESAEEKNEGKKAPEKPANITVEFLTTLNIRELRDMCKLCVVPVAGSKSELIKRLSQHLKLIPPDPVDVPVVLSPELEKLRKQAEEELRSKNMIEIKLLMKKSGLRMIGPKEEAVKKLLATNFWHPDRKTTEKPISAEKSAKPKKSPEESNKKINASKPEKKVTSEKPNDKQKEIVNEKKKQQKPELKEKEDKNKVKKEKKKEAKEKEEKEKAKKKTKKEQKQREKEETSEDEDEDEEEEKKPKEKKKRGRKRATKVDEKKEEEEGKKPKKRRKKKEGSDTEDEGTKKKRKLDEEASEKPKRKRGRPSKKPIEGASASEEEDSSDQEHRKAKSAKSWRFALNQMTVPELKQALKELGLPGGRTKPILIEKMVSALTQGITKISSPAAIQTTQETSTSAVEDSTSQTRKRKRPAETSAPNSKTENGTEKKKKQKVQEAEEEQKEKTPKKRARKKKKDTKTDAKTDTNTNTNTKAESASTTKVKPNVASQPSPPEEDAEEEEEFVLLDSDDDAQPAAVSKPQMQDTEVTDANEAPENAICETIQTTPDPTGSTIDSTVSIADSDETSDAAVNDNNNASAVEPEPEIRLSKEEYAKKLQTTTVIELREMLRVRRLGNARTKAALIDKLVRAYDEESAPVATTSPAEVEIEEKDKKENKEEVEEEEKPPVSMPQKRVLKRRAQSQETATPANAASPDDKKEETSLNHNKKPRVAEDTEKEKARKDKDKKEEKKEKENKKKKNELKKKKKRSSSEAEEAAEPANNNNNEDGEDEASESASALSETEAASSPASRGRGNRGGRGGARGGRGRGRGRGSSSSSTQSAANEEQKPKVIANPAKRRASAAGRLQSTAASTPKDAPSSVSSSNSSSTPKQARRVGLSRPRQSLHGNR